MTDPSPEPVDVALLQRQKNLRALRRDWRERDLNCGDGYDPATGRTWNNHGFRHIEDPLGPVARADIKDISEEETK